MNTINRLVTKLGIFLLIWLFPVCGFSQFVNSDSCICYSLIYSYLRINVDNFNELQIYQCEHGFEKNLFTMNKVRVVESKRYLVELILQGTDIYFTFYINTINNKCLLLSYGRTLNENIYMKGIREFYKTESSYIDRLSYIERQSLIFDIILQSTMQAFIIDHNNEIMELNRSLFDKSFGILPKDSLQKIIKSINFKFENKKSCVIIFDNAIQLFGNRFRVLSKEKNTNIFYSIFIVENNKSGRSSLTRTIVWYYNNIYFVKQRKKLNYISGTGTCERFGPRLKIFNEWI